MDVVDRCGVGGFDVRGDVEGLEGLASVIGAEELAFADGGVVCGGLFASGPEVGDGGELLHVGVGDDALGADGAEADEGSSGL